MNAINSAMPWPSRVTRLRTAERLSFERAAAGPAGNATQSRVPQNGKQERQSITWPAARPLLISSTAIIRANQRLDQIKV